MKQSHLGGPALAWRWGKTEWIQAKDAKPSPVALRLPRSGDEPSTITVIAEKAAPKKLVRTYQNAEVLLAARARR